jgi:hypothetical protein
MLSRVVTSLSYLLSRRSVSKSGFVQREITEALDMLKQFPPDRIFLIPARLEECRPKHSELEEIQWVDLFPQWDVGFEEVRQAIQKRAGVVVQPRPDRADGIIETFAAHPTSPDDIVIETITSASSFMRRLQTRGEMRGCDAMGLRFISEVFRDFDFRGANFVHCRFDRCDFSASNLKGANFEGTVFTDCQLAGADLWGVNFWGADLRRVGDLGQANLQLTNLYEARLSIDVFPLQRSQKALELCDYGTFLRYFAEELGMDDATISQIFIWVNHRYFRLMFGKDPELKWRRLVTALDLGVELGDDT